MRTFGFFTARAASGAVDGISGEHFVGALAGEHDDYVLAGPLRQVVQRHAGRVRHGLVEVPDQVRQEIREVLRGDGYLGVVGVQRARHAPRLVQLRRTVLGEVADRKALHPLAAALPAQVHHVGRDRRGVEPAREEHAERHVGHQPDPDRVAHALPQLPGELVVRALIRLGREEAMPVAANGKLALLVDGVRGGRQLVDALEGGEARGHVAQAQVEIEGLLVELARNGRIAEKRLHFRAEDQTIAAEVVIDRLLAQPVSREEEPLSPCVPDGEGEHPRDALRQRVAPLLVAVDEDLGIAAAAEDMSARDELRAQIEVVVDLAVERDPDGAVLVAHRLRAGRGEIDDGQAAMTEGDGAVDVHAGAVGSAVRNDLRHARDQIAVGGPGEIAVQEAADAAHAGSSTDGRERTCRAAFAVSGAAANP